MSAQATMAAAGGATVPASGEYTQDAIEAVAALIRGGAAVIEAYGSGGVATVPAPEYGRYLLAIPGAASLRGAVTLPDGYGAALVNGAVSLAGGGRNTTVLAAGTFDYDGAAIRVAQTAGAGRIRDSRDTATIDLGNGRYSVTASGAAQVIRLESGVATISALAADDTVMLGATAFPAPARPSPNALPEGSTVLLKGARTIVELRQTDALIVEAGGAATIDGIVGSATIFATTGDVYRGRDAVVEFLGTGSSQTVVGGTGNDTVFGNGNSVTGPGSSILYREGPGSGHIFVSGLGAATVEGNGGGAIFGTGGTLFDDMRGARDILVTLGHGSADTVLGGGAAPTVFAAGARERIVVQGRAGGILVDNGLRETLDASATDGGNTFFVLSTTGDATLTGSARRGGSDSFVVLHTEGGGAHRIDIVDFHPGSAVFLSGYGQPDVAEMDRRVAAGAPSFTLSDGTTVAFDGEHPHYALGSAIF